MGALHNRSRKQYQCEDEGPVRNAQLENIPEAVSPCEGLVGERTFHVQYESFLFPV